MINRKKWTKKHNPILNGINPESPLTVGNGELAYSVDVTGLQTFYDEYRKDTPLCTQAQWGWHTIPADCPAGFYTLDDVVMDEYDYNGRTVTYARTKQQGNEHVFDWLRMNPHKFNLARIGLRFLNEEIRAESITDIRQELKLYDGYIESTYKLYGKCCTVKTLCDSDSDTVAVSIRSELLRSGLTIDVDFPYGTADITGSDWENESKHETLFNEGVAACTMDGQSYYVRIQAVQGMAEQVEKHRIRIKSDSDYAEVIFTFAKEPDKVNAANVSVPDLFNNIFMRTKNYWNAYWEKGGAVAFTGSSDERAEELERRIVLSLYLLAVNCAGSEPPQETGLTCNSWFGKAHLEMYFWHLAWAPLWNHSELLMRSIPWYHKHIEQARYNAERNGYKGARWPKMVGCDACDSPSKIAVLLVWQQPHIIMMLELLKRAMLEDDKHQGGNEENVCKVSAFMRENWILIKETVQFMVDYVVKDDRGIYHIVPPVIPVQERHLPEDTLDPSFEVAYWKFALKTAISWAEYLAAKDFICDDAEIARWREVYADMATPPIAGGVYIAQANCPETFETKAIDHPLMLQNYGMLPDMDVDTDIMRNTLEQVIDKWDYLTLWGWDFAVIAMTATRLNMPETAINQLLCETNKNCYVESGNNRQISRADLPLYLPGNGSLLLAAAMMTAGYDGSTALPGYPKDGTWTVEYDNLHPYI